MRVTALKLARGFSDRATDLLDRLDYRLIETDHEREQIFRLRYEAYLREGAIAPNFTRKLYDRFDDAENSWTFGLHIDGKIIVDPNRFVVAAKAARAFPELPYLTVRLGFIACPYFGADIATASVRPEHQAFYKRIFGLKPMCEPRSYPTVTKPLSLMMVDYPSVREKILARPYFRSTFFERRMLFERAPHMPRSTAEMLRAKLPSANINEAAEADSSAISL